MTDTSQASLSHRNYLSQVRQILREAFDDDKFVCRIKYRDKNDNETDRVISPIRFANDQSKHVLALCLGREETRQFAVDRILSIELVKANEAQMPEEINEPEPLQTTDSVSFTVHGAAKPQGSKRAMMNHHTKRPIVMESAGDALKQWRYSVAQAAAEAMNGFEIMTEAVAVRIMFYLPRPKGHYGTGKNANIVKSSSPNLPTTKPDIDKLARAVCDSLSKSSLS